MNDSFLVPHRLVYHLGAIREQIGPVGTCEHRGGYPSVSLRNPGDRSSHYKDVALVHVGPIEAQCSVCSHLFHPLVSGEGQTDTHISCPDCKEKFIVFYNYKSNLGESLKLHLPEFYLGRSLSNLQHVMDAYSRGRGSSVELKMDDEGSGSLLLDDSWGRRGDVCYTVLHEWDGWQGFAELLTDISLEHIRKFTANPGKLPSGWVYYLPDTTATRKTFHTLGQPTYQDEQGEWRRYGPASKAEMDWRY